MLRSVYPKIMATNVQSLFHLSSLISMLQVQPLKHGACQIWESSLILSMISQRSSGDKTLGWLVHLLLPHARHQLLQWLLLLQAQGSQFLQKSDRGRKGVSNTVLLNIPFSNARKKHLRQVRYVFLVQMGLLAKLMCFFLFCNFKSNGNASHPFSCSLGTKQPRKH